jgi:hypothetical protein
MPEDSEEPKSKRKSRPGHRHRRDNGPAELAVDPVPPPNLQELGTLTRYSQEVIAGGPRALIAAEHQAAKLAAQFGVEFEKTWFLKTPYLAGILSGEAIAHLDPRGQAKAQTEAKYALKWRPRFLAVYALSRSNIFATRAAKIGINTPGNHRQADPDFDAQCEAAEQHAIQLLHDVTMKSAIEGECEPVLWQGIPVAWVRKVDNRLRIEMLRAHMPKTFKTPGAKVAIATGNVYQGNNFLVCGDDEVAALQAMRQESLKRIVASKQPTITVE